MRKDFELSTRVLKFISKIKNHMMMVSYSFARKVGLKYMADMFLSGFRDNTKQSVQGIKMLNSKVIVFANLWLSGCLAQYDMSNCTLSLPVTLSIRLHKTVWYYCKSCDMATQTLLIDV